MRTIVHTRMLEAAAELRAMANRTPQRTAPGDAAPKPLARPIEQYIQMLENQGPLARYWRRAPELVVSELIAAVCYYRDAAARTCEESAAVIETAPDISL
jgi:hypothetical protein